MSFELSTVVTDLSDMEYQEKMNAEESEGLLEVKEPEKARPNPVHPHL